ncbi:MAG: hypothetical protein LBP85_00585 [Prevotellaceae bacterium]|jgi:hypothetical protein|nr:hypothetical protein [Prevotellaceae bacterium]
MSNSVLKYKIGQKRPRHKEQYRSLIDSISVKGNTSGKGDFSAFGAFYQTYMIDNFIAELFRQMEGYANAGFEYLQDKWDNEKIEFQDPFVFVNFLEELRNCSN